MKRLAHYSQYFLRNPRLIKELIGHSNLTATDLVLDIGAGSGVISSVLAQKVKHIIAIEPESRMAQKLRDNISAYKNVEVYEGDFLTMPLPKGKYKVFANIPFHLSSQIMRRLTEAVNSPEALHLVVQKQFANKLLADGNHFTGQLGMMVGPLYTTRIRKRLKRTDFWPHPNVDTVFLELTKRSQPLISLADMPEYRTFTERCFADPKIFAKTPRQKLGLPNDIKPSQLTLEQWIELFLASQTIH